MWSARRKVMWEGMVAWWTPHPTTVGVEIHIHVGVGRKWWLLPAVELVLVGVVVGGGWGWPSGVMVRVLHD